MKKAKRIILGARGMLEVAGDGFGDAVLTVYFWIWYLSDGVWPASWISMYHHSGAIGVLAVGVIPNLQS